MNTYLRLMSDTEQMLQGLLHHSRFNMAVAPDCNIADIRKYNDCAYEVLKEYRKRLLNPGLPLNEQAIDDAMGKIEAIAEGFGISDIASSVMTTRLSQSFLMSEQANELSSDEMIPSKISEMRSVANGMTLDDGKHSAENAVDVGEMFVNSSIHMAVSNLTTMASILTTDSLRNSAQELLTIKDIANNFVAGKSLSSEEVSISEMKVGIKGIFEKCLEDASLATRKSLNGVNFGDLTDFNKHEDSQSLGKIHGLE